MTDDALHFDELELGREWLSEDRLVSADDVSGFADLTGDRNPLHLDPEFARATPFRRCIAHGLLGLSLAGALGLTAPRLKVMALLSLDRWSFHFPIYVGDTIRVRQSVAGLESHGRGRRGTVRWRVDVLTGDGRVAQSGVCVLLVEARVRVAA